MENKLLISDISSLKELFQEPIYLIKSEFELVTQNTKTDNAISETPLFNAKGANLKNNVFIVFSESNHILEKDLDLYSKTIAALKLSEKDIAFCISDFSLANQFETIAQSFKNQKIVCFGNAKTYKENLLSIQNIDTSQILLCPSLTELAENKDLKINWWNTLKSFVNV